MLTSTRAIRESVPAAHVRLIGEDGGAADALRRRAHELGLSHAITFEGAHPREELPAAYRAASVCVVPSRFEAFPYTCMEAMACGRPLVASNVGGVPEVLGDQGTGLLVAPEDPAALGGAVSRLLLDPAARVRLGESARRRVVSSFAARTVAARMVDLYGEVIS